MARQAGQDNAVDMQAEHVSDLLQHSKQSMWQIMVSDTQNPSPAHDMCHRPDLSAQAIPKGTLTNANNDIPVLKVGHLQRQALFLVAQQRD